MDVNLRTLSRASLSIGHDAIMAAASFVLSLYFRLGQNPFDYGGGLAPRGTVVFTLVAVGVFWFMGLHRGVWRYSSLVDLLQITRAVSLVILIFVLLLFWMTRLEAMPRSSLAINWFVLIALLGGPRLLFRMFKDKGSRAIFTTPDSTRIPVLLVGAGDGAELFIRAMANNPTAGYRVVGLIDDKGTRIGREIHGLTVAGDLAALDRVIEKLTAAGARPQRIVVTENTLSGAPMRELLDQTDALGLTLSRLPDLTDFKSGVTTDLKVKPVALEDLLGRPQTVLDRASMEAMIRGRRVLVTGAGGTIGGELVRQISDHGPAHLTLLDNSEYALYRIDQELRDRHGGLSQAAVLGDIRNRTRLDSTLAIEKPDLVFHAAAFKHVPMVEAHPLEGVMTNVVGSRNVADACLKAGVDAMVMISTDKAVNPTSVMGATKRIAESYCQALAAAGSARAGAGAMASRFVTVRFGNVLGSTGSVVPLFLKQLARGGPLTVTHPEVNRYFMTVREAVELVLEASVLGMEDGNGPGKIFVLDMGEPIRIADLAKQMIRLAGLRPDIDIEIRFTGLRPGEKLTEELFHAAEQPQPTRYAGVLLTASRKIDLAALSSNLDALETACRAGDTGRTSELLRELVPEYAAGPPSSEEPARERKVAR